MRISDWSSDVCSSDLILQQSSLLGKLPPCCSQLIPHSSQASFESAAFYTQQIGGLSETAHLRAAVAHGDYVEKSNQHQRDGGGGNRSEEHTSELQSLMRFSYAGICLKKKIIYN